MRQELYFDSRSGKDRLHAVRWVPEGEVAAVLQIVHGMAEHIERYDGFASYLAERGVLVVGHSHLGHGKSVKKAEELGFFAEPDGNGCVVGISTRSGPGPRRNSPECHISSWATAWAPS